MAEGVVPVPSISLFLTVTAILAMDVELTRKGQLGKRERARLMELIEDALGRCESVWHAEVVELMLPSTLKRGSPGRTGAAPRTTG